MSLRPGVGTQLTGLNPDKPCLVDASCPYLVVDTNAHLLIPDARSQTISLRNAHEAPVQYSLPQFAHSRVLLCEEIDRSMLQDVFGSSCSETSADECVWAIVNHELCLSNLKSLEARTIVRQTPLRLQERVRSCDGPVAVITSPTSQRQGYLSKPTGIVRLNRSAMVILEYGGAVRHLDLERWILTTVCVLPVDAPPPLIYPDVSSPLSAFPVIRSDKGIILETQSGPSRLDIASGTLTPIPKPTTDDPYYIPIASSRGTPTYLLRYSDRTELMRVRGRFKETLRLPEMEVAGAAHIASTNLTVLLTRDNPNSQKELSVRPYVSSNWKPYIVGPTIRLPPTDLSFVINNPNFPADLTIKQESYAWKIPSGILRNLHPSFTPENLVRAIQPFPFDSVDLFIAYLFGKRLSLTKNTKSLTAWTHASRMWQELGFEGENLPSLVFAHSLSECDEEVLCSLLVDVWNDSATNWKREDFIVQSLTFRVIELCHEKFGAMLASQPSTRNMELAFAMFALKGAPVPAIPRLRDTIARGLRAIHVHLVECPADPKTLLYHPNDFVLVVEDHNKRMAMVGDMVYMYSRWKWFKRLMKMGCVEKRDRVAEMPNWMSPSCLAALIEQVHADCHHSLSLDDALTLMEHRKEFNLVNRTETPSYAFVSLVRSSMDQIFPPLSKSNVLSQLRSAHRLDVASKRLSILLCLIKGTYQFDAMHLVDELPLELLALLKLQRAAENPELQQ